MYNLLTFVTVLLFSSVTACWALLGWVAWWRMRPQYQPARQKCPLLPKPLPRIHNFFTTPGILLPDVFLIVNDCLEIEISKWIHVNDLFGNKWAIIKQNTMTAFLYRFVCLGKKEELDLYKPQLPPQSNCLDLSNRITQKILIHSQTTNDDNWCLLCVWMGEWMRIIFVYLCLVSMFVGLCHDILYIFYKQKHFRKELLNACMKRLLLLLFCIFTIQFMLGYVWKL